MVGAEGREPFGSCLSRLSQPTLADGYLPILETRYVDGAGVRYRRSRSPCAGSAPDRCVSFVA